jgi:oxygen-independent coproporphyrinogen-3 oxidase
MDTPHASTIFDPALVARYDGAGPRYTSYPTALSFNESHGLVEYFDVARTSNLLDPKPLSVYVHVPFCESPCFYCGCNRVITRDRRRADDYLVRLHAEIDRQGRLFDRARLVDQLHFGGGSPTFLDGAQLADVFAKRAQVFTLRKDPDREYSIEIDPRTVSADRLEVLSNLGFNRISLGTPRLRPRCSSRGQPSAIRRRHHRAHPQGP